MIKRLPLIFMLCFSQLIPESSWAEDSIVIVATSPDTQVASLSRNDVADLFLGTRRLYAGVEPLVPVDTKDENLRNQFYKAVAGMSSNRVRGHWAHKVFSSQGSPPRELEPMEAARLVLKEPGIVIYTYSSKLNPQDKVLLRLE